MNNQEQLLLKKNAELQKEVIGKTRELEIESSLERVRTVAMSMNKPDDMLEVCRIISEQLEQLGVKEIRNVQTAIFYVSRGTYMNYEYYVKYKKTFITDTDYTNHEVAKAFAEKMLKGKGEVSITYIKGKKKVKDWIAYQKTTNVFIDIFLEQASSLNYYWHSLGPVALGISTYVPLKIDELKLFQRFIKVFELSYTRYLDIEQALGQARESRIQLALEKVRARTMAMQHSDELKSAATLLFQQAIALGVPAYSCGYNIWEQNEKAFTSWMSTQDGRDINAVLNIPLTEDANFIRYVESKKKGEQFFVLELSGQRMQEHYDYLKTIPAFKAYFDYAVSVGFDLPQTQIHHVANFSQGNLLFITLRPCPEFHEVFKRFAAVFEQTYTRFLDLQKAEAQARESQIQLALERVRARTMAMQKSDELQDAAILLFRQIKLLGIQTGSCGFNIWNKEKRSVTVWMSSPEGGLQAPFDLPFTKSPIYQSVYAAMKNGEIFLVKKIGGKDLVKHFDYLQTLPGIGNVIKHLREKGYPFPETMVYHFAFFNNGYLSFHLHEHYPEAENIFKRFAKVFEQTYTRFLDLQKAEAQAREAQIETALERVRSRSMAMQKSEEMKGVIRIVYEQFVHLKINIHHAGFVVDYTLKGDWHFWIADEQDIPSKITHPYFDSVWANQFDEAKEKGLDFFATNLNFEEKNKFYKELFSYVSDLSEESKSFYLSCPGVAASTALFDNFSLYIENFSGTSYTDEENQILIRFGKVFQQIYTRFLDLQKAEAQSRESQIEASLERVRSKAMSMQKSEDFAASVATVFDELDKLNLGILRCGIGILNKLTCSADVWTTTKSDQGTMVHLAGNEPMNAHPLFQGVFDAWLHQQENYSYVLQGEDMSRFYKAVANTNFQLPDSQSIIAATNELKQYYFVTTFQSGGLYAFRDTPFPEEAKTVMKRFADVFNFTYTRFNDLKQAEAQTREAIKASSLDRVRAEIASMRTTDDLQRITPSIWKELIVLGVPFLRCGVFIIDEKEKKIHVYLSTPEGEPLAVLHLDFDSSDTIRGIIQNWRTQKMYTEHWDREQFISWTKSLIGQGQIDTQKAYQSGDLPPESLTLQFVPFIQGILYISSKEPLSETQIELVHILAKAFSTAYARYEDFNKLELAKKQIEKTLIELKQAQAQLIQSEKMASLGELTAGIAHEIQNPLNFVNNFSEINNELIEELKSQKPKLKTEEQDEILNDIFQNNEKINHHGRRADAIVKGMLQHSRHSSGIKEPTDINALVDEYLRLCYHGLRAKDKSFNADFKTDFDETIRKINIVPQDIGRVLLNIISNAFYATNEKKKNADKYYQPLISIQTKKINHEIKIMVADNGNGIPPKILDKIFQPFFTTKPTGQGTGLGLSLSHDILKAHNGSISVKSKEDQGATFTIQLPAE